MLTLGFAVGTAPDKWLRRFNEGTDHGGVRGTGVDDPVEDLLGGEVALALVRLPDSRIDDEYHVVELYEEQPGVAVPKDSVYAEVGEAVAAEDVAEEHVNYSVPESGEVDVEALRTALQVVAANVGVAFAPRPLLKALSKKQVVHLDYLGSAPHTRVALVFRKDADCDAIQDFIGVAKGRTLRSSRQVAPKLNARQKAEAKKRRRAQAQGRSQNPKRRRR